MIVLSDHTQLVTFLLNQQLSLVLVTFGLPQGSIPGSLLYVLYTADLSHIISYLGAAAHEYAGNSHAYIHDQDAEAISFC